MRLVQSICLGCLAFLCLFLWQDCAQAFPAGTERSVVSVLPVWPNQTQDGSETPPGVAPEGSGVVLEGGVVVTAWHVIEPARRIDVRLSDGRILPAELIGHDRASDIAVLKVDAELDSIEISAELALTDPVCSIGNAFGLGLSATCGIVSAVHVSNAGFNPVEDFVQTDAALNPGSSGGALVNQSGQLVGMVSAIFASQGDTNTGVGFAVSAPLLTRVVDQLLAEGKVSYPAPGWRFGSASREQLKRIAAPEVLGIQPGGLADVAGLQVGDLVLRIGPRRVLHPRDAIAALAIVPPDTPSVPLVIERDGRQLDVVLPLQHTPAEIVAQPVPQPTGDCPHPELVCLMRQAVFPVSSFDPVASATRIGPDLLVTNRHVVGDWTEAVVLTPTGPQNAQVVPSSYTGDMVLLEVDGLPEGGYIPDLQANVLSEAKFYAVGADVARQQVRVFDPGTLIAAPAADADLGRIHVTAQMQPGVSGGALVQSDGTLVGIAVGGGDGRFEAIPLSNVRDLIEGRSDDVSDLLTTRLGRAFAECAAMIDAASSGAAEDFEALSDTCATSMNHGQLLEAGRTLAQAGAFDEAAKLHGQAARQVPNSINTRMSLLVSLQLGARFEDMTEHARFLMQMAPDDPGALRFGIQSGVWGGDPDLAEEAYQHLLNADPRQAEAARRFIDNAPPAPQRRN